MIMMSPFRGGFISSFSISKFPLGGHAETGEKLEGAVNIRLSDFRVYFRDLGINLANVLMSGRVQEDVEDLFPLSGRLQPYFINSLPKQVSFHGPPHIEIEFQFHFKGSHSVCQYLN